jgi:hypothetical protein
MVYDSVKLAGGPLKVPISAKKYSDMQGCPFLATSRLSKTVKNFNQKKMNANHLKRKTESEVKGSCG